MQPKKKKKVEIENLASYVFFIYVYIYIYIYIYIIYIFIYLGLCWVLLLFRLFSTCGWWGYSLVAVCGLFIVMVSLVAEWRL